MAMVKMTTSHTTMSRTLSHSPSAMDGSTFQP
jgi:hypothetical protein